MLELRVPDAGARARPVAVELTVFEVLEEGVVLLGGHGPRVARGTEAVVDGAGDGGFEQVARRVGHGEPAVVLEGWGEGEVVLVGDGAGVTVFWERGCAPDVVGVVVAFGRFGEVGVDRVGVVVQPMRHGRVDEVRCDGVCFWMR